MISGGKKKGLGLLQGVGGDSTGPSVRTKQVHYKPTSEHPVVRTSSSGRWGTETEC